MADKHMLMQDYEGNAIYPRVTMSDVVGLNQSIKDLVNSIPSGSGGGTITGPIEWADILNKPLIYNRTEVDSLLGNKASTTDLEVKSTVTVSDTKPATMGVNDLFFRVKDPVGGEAVPAVQLSGIIPIGKKLRVGMSPDREDVISYILTVKLIDGGYEYLMTHAFGIPNGRMMNYPDIFKSNTSSTATITANQAPDSTNGNIMQVYTSTSKRMTYSVLPIAGGVPEILEVVDK